MSKNKLLSVVIISKNEAERIEDCLQSVSWADEIVVVDSGSVDSTCEIVRRYTDKIYEISWLGFGLQKQKAVELATHDWILSVDCDERVTPALANEIRSILSCENHQVAYSVPRRTFLGAKEIRHCGWYPDRTIRLFNRRKAHFSDKIVHERVVTNETVGFCKEHLLHLSFSGLSPLLLKLNHYSDLSARQMFEQGRSYSILDLTIRPLFAFFKTYLLQNGFLDGIEGLEISVTSALLTFVKYAKLRELSARNLISNRNGKKT